jgi:hypothetical protein
VATATRTGGNDSIAKAQALILEAREKLIVARSFLVDEGRMIPCMTCDDVLAELVTLIGEVGAA